MISRRVGGGGVAVVCAAPAAGGVTGGGPAGGCAPATATSPRTFAASVAMMPVWRNSRRSICLAVGAAASRRFPPAPPLGALHSLPLRRVAPFRAQLFILALGAAASRRFPPAPLLSSLHSLALRRLA